MAENKNRIMEFKTTFKMLIVPMFIIAIYSFCMLFLDTNNTTKLTYVTFLLWVFIYFGFWVLCVWVLSKLL